MAEPLISTRVDRSLIRELDRLARSRGESRSVVVRDLIEGGLARARFDDAIDAYSRGSMTAWKAAEEAGVPLWQFIDALKRERIPLPRAYAEEDALLDLGQALSRGGA